MPVTIKPTENRASEASCTNIASAINLLQSSCPDEYAKFKRMMWSSFPEVGSQNVSKSNNGFIYACMQAYNSHHHLTIRPEDVWFAIICQLGFYVNGNAEELRSIFVSHQGQKELSVESTIANFPLQIMSQMSKYMNDPDLPEWIKPDFSTTTPDDVVVACILMMGGMQQYFSYCMIMCGLPSVTLLGTKDDWKKIFDKIDRLAEISEQAATFHSLLKPVLGYFVRSFDEPDGTEVKSFWNRIVHLHPGGSGPTYLSGWITAFCFWDFEGKLLYEPPRQAPGSWTTASTIGCNLDGTLYHCVDDLKIPAGYMGVPVTVLDGSAVGTKCRMVAGSVGIQCNSSGKPMEIIPRMSNMSNRHIGRGRTIGGLTGKATEEVVGLDSVQPLSGWWMFEMFDDKEKQENEQVKKDDLAKNRSTAMEKLQIAIKDH
jgi:hypothetical protein